MKGLIKILFVFVFVASAAVMGQEKPDYVNDPGYVDFGNFGGLLKGNNVTEVNLEKYLLKMVGNLTEKNDPELSALLNGLKLVKVYSFDVNNKDVKELNSKIDKLDSKLTSENWNRIVKVKGPHENTNVYIKTTPDQSNIAGLVVTSLEKNGKASFVNIVGKINMDALGRLGEKFDIPSIEKVRKEKRHSDEKH